MPLPDWLLRKRCDLAYRLNYAMARDVLVAVERRDGGRILGHVTQCRANWGKDPTYVIGGREVRLDTVESVESRRPPRSRRAAA
jgi:hypothetical protein